MNAYLKVAGTLLCCLLLQQVQAVDTSPDDEQGHLCEKGSKSKSEIILDMPVCSSPRKPGPKGDPGPRGHGFSQAYASAYQSLEVNLGEKFIDDIVQLPFDTVDYSKRITLDDVTNTFTLPKGVYLVDFQFVIDDDSKYAFGQMYFDIGGVPLNVSWAPAGNDPDEGGSLSSFSGSTIFEVPANGTPVAFFMKINRKETLSDPTPNYDFVFKYPSADNNYPTRIVFRKIASLA